MSHSSTVILFWCRIPLDAQNGFNYWRRLTCLMHSRPVSRFHAFYPENVIGLLKLYIVSLLTELIYHPLLKCLVSNCVPSKCRAFLCSFEDNFSSQLHIWPICTTVGSGSISDIFGRLDNIMWRYFPTVGRPTWTKFVYREHCTQSSIVWNMLKE